MTKADAGSLPPKAVEEMSATLYDSPGPILSGTAVLCVTSGLIAYRTQSPIAWAGFAALCVIGILRIGLVMAYVRSPPHSRTGGGMAAWRRAYALGILACSATVGMLTMGCILSQADATTHMVLVATAVGYGSSVAGRNAACLEVSLPQLWAALLPTAAGLLYHGQMEYGVLGAVILVFGLGMSQIGISINRSIACAYLSADKIVRMSRNDSLTDLLNRSAASDAIDACLRAGDPFSVLLIDLDRFKGVNDAFGHAVGDGLLKAVADRMRANLPHKTLAARLGGDEFVIIHPSDIVTPGILATLLSKLLSEPYNVDGRELSISASIGVASSPSDGQNANMLMRNADTALYQVKSGGRCGWRAFDPGMDDEERARRALEADMREALSTDQLHVVYQPQMDLSTGRSCTYEALVRWTHPERGDVPPSDFIPLAEETGMIHLIGLTVLERACREAGAWADDVRVAVNISPVQFRNDLPGSIAAILSDTGLSGSRLELEVTENVFLESKDEILADFRRLREMGVRISLDDFGTGYSSLGYLRSFPFQKVKIDRSFVGGIEAPGDARAVVRAVVALDDDLGMQVVVEGVETHEQLSALRELGCGAVQGYLVSRPLPPAEVSSWAPSVMPDLMRHAA